MSLLLLLVMQLGSVLVLCQPSHGYLDEETGDEEMRRGVLSMLAISLASCVDICGLLYTQVSELYAVLLIIYRCAFCFFVAKVITAVCIEKTKARLRQRTGNIMFKESREQIDR